VWLASAVTVLFALGIAGGLADVFVRRLLAVPASAADLGMRWIWVLLPLPAIWMARSYFRGGVMANDATAWISYAGLAHATVLVGVLAGLTSTTLPGVACAAIALTAGVLTEAALTLVGMARSGPTRFGTVRA
jgi:hypothetical protein